MSTAPDRLSADLRAFEREQDGEAEFNRKFDEISRELALNLIRDGERLASLVYDYQIDLFSQLARAFRNLDQACIGDKTARDACLNALSHMQKISFVTAMKEVSREAETRAQD